MNTYTDFLLNRASRMFTISGLPPEIDERFLMLQKIMFGAVGIAPRETEDKQCYLWRGYAGGEIGQDFAPKSFIGTNPIGGSVDFEIGKTGAAFFNSTTDRFGGYFYLTPDIKPPSRREKISAYPATALYRYIKRTGEQLTEIDISVKSLLRTSRASFFISAKDEQTKTAAEIAIKRLLDGEEMTVFMSNLLDSLQFTFSPTAQNAAGLLSELREQYQFTLAEFYHAIGINANYNLKRERLNTAEVDLNTEPLLVNIADMHKCMIEGAEQCNRIFGWNVAVKLSEEWKRKEAGENDNAEKVVNKNDEPGTDV